MASPKFEALLTDKSVKISCSGEEVWRDTREVGGCFCGGVNFLIFQIASVAGNADESDGDFDGGEGVKEAVDVVDEWVC